MSDRVLVAGCGAIGSVFACLLGRAGHDVSVLVRPAQAAKIRDCGISITGIWGEHHTTKVRALSRAEELDRAYDCVLVTCKSYQTAALLEEIGDRAGAEGVAVSLQNGLGNVERLEKVYGTDRVLAGRVIFGAELSAAGSVRVTVEAEPVLIGRYAGGGDARARLWAASFDRAGIACQASDSIRSALWAKIFYNAALNPLGALLALSYRELAADAERRRVMSRIIEEAFRVALAEGVELAWSHVNDYLEVFYGRLVPATADHRSSMLQDIERRRQTEIDAICGEVCRRGDGHGIDTPLNRLLMILVAARSAVGHF